MTSSFVTIDEQLQAGLLPQSVNQELLLAISPLQSTAMYRLATRRSPYSSQVRVRFDGPSSCSLGLLRRDPWPAST